MSECRSRGTFRFNSGNIIDCVIYKLKLKRQILSKLAFLRLAVFLHRILHIRIETYASSWPWHYLFPSGLVSSLKCPSLHPHPAVALPHLKTACRVLIRGNTCFVVLVMARVLCVERLSPGKFLFLQVKSPVKVPLPLNFMSGIIRWRNIKSSPSPRSMSLPSINEVIAPSSSFCPVSCFQR